jgi:putative lipase involved disintegration of autophagic bodies
VGYVGAYKAIKDLYPDAYIRSIVGSSAGGMIALAISAGASIE